jgi:hypothetical protein
MAVPGGIAKRTPMRGEGALNLCVLEIR